MPAGVQATMTHADGTTERLDAMHVRVTEFTVGALGRARMPAPLPPLSQYTYAFEINADEAVASGSKSISFSQPLIYYVDNFLNFPSGTPVPLGSFDREHGIWVPSPSGIVIKLVSITGGLADLSIDSDAAAETPAEPPPSASPATSAPNSRRSTQPARACGGYCCRTSRSRGT